MHFPADKSHSVRIFAKVQYPHQSASPPPEVWGCDYRSRDLRDPENNPGHLFEFPRCPVSPSPRHIFRGWGQAGIYGTPWGSL